jgi:molybdopterin synthase sulfur carrier subunit
MSIQVRYFASIRELLGRSEQQIDGKDILSAADVWERAAAMPWPANALVAVNQEHARPQDPVRDGDEVAFFPPVTGG